MSNTDIMLRYNSVWETFDIGAILEFFAEDGISDMVNVRKATDTRRFAQSLKP